MKLLVVSPRYGYTVTSVVDAETPRDAALEALGDENSFEGAEVWVCELEHAQRFVVEVEKTLVTRPPE